MSFKLKEALLIIKILEVTPMRKKTSSEILTSNEERLIVWGKLFLIQVELLLRINLNSELITTQLWMVTPIKIN
jgi:hypothetical protein